MYSLLIINPGSLSTKISVFHDTTEIFTSNIQHTMQELSRFPSVMDQYAFRKQLVLNELEAHHTPLQFDAVVGRGPLTRAVKSGTYAVTHAMSEATRTCRDQHACNLGCIIARDIADQIPGCRAYFADPGTTDEMMPEARISGVPQIPHRSVWHALNQKEVARIYCREHGVRYEDLNLIVCHMGGGISIAAHRKGQAVDVNNALNGDGPFTPNRAGTLPTADLVRLCYSGQYTEQQLLKILKHHSGLLAHLGTNDPREVKQMIDAGDDHARVVFDAMILRIAQSIVAEAAVFCAPPDAIILTGGLAHSDYLVSHLKQRVGWLAPVAVYAGQKEMLALAENAIQKMKEEDAAANKQ